MAMARPIAAGQEGGSDGFRSLSGADRLAWLLVALAPAIFAIASWSRTGERNSVQALLLSFSLPITAIEMVVILFAARAGFQPSQAVARLPAWALIALVLLVAVAAGTAALVAPNGATAILRTIAWAIHLLFGFSAWYLLGTRWAPLRRAVWPWIAAGVALYVLVLAALVLAIPDEAAFNWKFLGLGVTHVRQVGFYSVVGAAAALGLAAVERSWPRYWLAVAAASLFLALSYWSGTRGSLFAILAAFGAGFVLLPAMRTIRAAAALVVGNAAGALIALVHVPPHPFYGVLRISRTAASASADAITTGRIAQWTASARAVLERPFFGHGESQYGFAVPAYAEFNHPHNILLQVALQWGLVGFACFFSLAALLGWRFVAAARGGGAGQAPAFLVAVGLATMALYEGSLYHPYPVMMFALALAFVLAAPARA